VFLGGRFASIWLEAIEQTAAFEQEYEMSLT